MKKIFLTLLLIAGITVGQAAPKDSLRADTLDAAAMTQIDSLRTELNTAMQTMVTQECFNEFAGRIEQKINNLTPQGHRSIPLGDQLSRIFDSLIPHAIFAGIVLIIFFVMNFRYKQRMMQYRFSEAVKLGQPIYLNDTPHQTASTASAQSKDDQLRLWKTLLIVMGCFLLMMSLIAVNSYGGVAVYCILLSVLSLVGVIYALKQYTKRSDELNKRQFPGSDQQQQ